jgi:hypothetical protein
VLSAPHAAVLPQSQKLNIDECIQHDATSRWGAMA